MGNKLLTVLYYPKAVAETIQETAEVAANERRARRERARLVKLGRETMANAMEEQFYAAGVAIAKAQHEGAPES